MQVHNPYWLQCAFKNYYYACGFFFFLSLKETEMNLNLEKKKKWGKNVTWSSFLLCIVFIFKF